MPPTEQKIGDYLILEKIAQGGMAHIYKAKTVDPSGIERLVVIKRILPHISSNPEYVEMLIDEAKIAVNFNHGNIAQIYDLGKVDNDYFIVMEYVDGKTLSQIIREFKVRGEFLPLDFIVHCFIEICQGLEYIHRKKGPDGKPLGIIHRDISPQNIIVSYSGTVKIIDFGVAKAEEKMGHTESGVLKGKFAYMSPEQADGNPVDGRSDIFSAGVLLWESLVLKRLYKRKSNLDTVKAVRKAKFVSPLKYREKIPRALIAIVEKALERKPHKRYPSAQEMAFDLNRFLFAHDPHYRPLHVAQFLYRYFGPEADEEKLPPELPELAILSEKTKNQPISPAKIRGADEEKTEVDYLKNFYHGLFQRPQVRPLTCVFMALIGLALVAAYFLHVVFIPSLTLVVSPSGSLLTINGEHLFSDHASHRFKHGKPLNIRITKVGYVPYKTTVVLKRGEQKTLPVNLKKIIPPYGDLSITTNPEGALVYLDENQWAQTTPTKISHLKTGKKIRVKITLEDYRPVEQEVIIEGGNTLSLNFGLEVDYASLEIISSPVGARVIMEDQIVGKTPYVNKRVEPGSTVEFALELEGYGRKAEVMTLHAGEKRQVTYILER